MGIYQGGREQKSLDFPFPFLWHSSRSAAHRKDPRCCAEQGPCLHPMFVHLMSRNEIERGERDPYSPPSPHPGEKEHPGQLHLHSLSQDLLSTIKFGESPSQAGHTSWKLTSPSKSYKYLSLVPPGVTRRTILCFQQEAKFAVIPLFVMILWPRI